MGEGSRITIVGLGPGGAEQLTLEADRALRTAVEVWLRTSRHPSFAALTEGRTVRSFDDLYESEGTFDAVYRAIAAKVIDTAAGGADVAYAVPGDPFVGEATVPLIMASAAERGIAVRIVHGVSFVEPALAAVGVDGLAAGIQVVDALAPNAVPARPALFAQVHDQRVATGLKLALLDLYPAAHQVSVVRHAGLADASVASVPLEDLDREDRFDHLTSVFVPALTLEEDTRTFDGFRAIIAKLRAPDGCPWDRKQTHQSLRKYLLEETYEALSALDAGDIGSLEEELGDILLQVLLQSQVAEDDGEFTVTDVVAGIGAKIIRRHPHVFGDVKVGSAEDVVQNWQALKDQEKAAKGDATGVLESVAPALPALALSQTLQGRAAGVGFDWPDVEGALEKVAEEVREVGDAAEGDERRDEFGDLLFSLVNVARHQGIDAEEALRLAAGKFRARFGEMEWLAASKGGDVRDLDLAALNALWDEAKVRLRSDAAPRVP